MDEILESIRTIVSDKFGVAKEEILKDSDLTGDLNLSGIEINDLIAIIAKEYKFEIPQGGDIEEVKTVSDLLNIVENYGELI